MTILTGQNAAIDACIASIVHEFNEYLKLFYATYDSNYKQAMVDQIQTTEIEGIAKYMKDLTKIFDLPQPKVIDKKDA